MPKVRVDEIVAAVEREDAMGLREMSREYSTLGVSDQREEVIDLALLTYCLNKIFSKVHFRENVGELKKNLTAKLSGKDFKGALKDVEEFDSKYGAFEGNLVGKARIKVGSRLYSRGLSLSQSASLVGVRVSDLLSYIGETKTHENIKPSSVAERLEVARKVIKG